MSIQAHHLARRYGRHWALRGISLTIQRGESVFLRGANGAGKTTLLRVLSTALQPSQGTLCLFGLDAQTHYHEIRQRLALITHHTHLYEALTAHENLVLLKNYGLILSTQELQSALARVNLKKHAHRPVSEFSAGMRRRLGLARMLLQKPELVLLDEPFGQLDVDGVQLQEEIITDFKQRGVTIIMSTHDHDRGYALCDRELWLDGGILRGATP